ncbi:hypothetical protein DL89DRAFT_129091 [Linderina pennispora]|uniref:Uncharacterized protein n=1 Tax=Linderina pennispora TaxID=61395 RepID=A0A1Y1WDI9_9FUNG|nr:uncharacterized protein DL89DRAFT_129091 [Linderina pennispora]ORX71590.1 hypothetical protein DL89DRAFT_129091 [Linderina pennispora]
MMACAGSRGACSAVGPSASRGTATVVSRGSASATATAGAGNSGSAHAPSSSTSFSRVFPIVSHGGVAVAQAVRQRGDLVAASVRHGSSGGTRSILVLNAATGVTGGNSSISGQGISGSGSSNKSADTKEHCCGVGGAQDAVCASAPNMVAALSPSAPISPSTPPSTQRTLTYATRPCSGAPGKRLALAQTLGTCAAECQPVHSARAQDPKHPAKPAAAARGAV